MPFSMPLTLEKMTKRTCALAALLLGMVGIQVGCSQDLKWTGVETMIRANYPGVPTITTDSLAERLSATDAPRPVLLDARSEAEYDVSHLPGAVRVDPDAETLPDSVRALWADGRPVVVYCSVGYRSAGVADRLADQGVDASNLKGSIFRWANEGRTVVDDGAPAEHVHPFNEKWGALLDAQYHPETYETPGGGS